MAAGLVRTGLDVVASGGHPALAGRLGLVTHQAAVARDLRHSLDVLRGAGYDVRAVFGPQHGIWGHTQDNMIEWEGYRDPRTGLPFYSLYGQTREPQPAWMAGLDRLVIDLVDVGCRVYTFVWTMALCLRVAERLGVAVTVLDRPNPISGAEEGPDLDPAFASFVGLHPLPMRHGRTIGEIAQWLVTEFYPGVSLTVVPCDGWKRWQWHDETGLPWVSPSPNMPSLATATVYPGMVLLEGTNLSEGRGTTRPFETVGAPWLDPWRFANLLSEQDLPGVHFRPVTFQPTFQKHAGEVCGGVFCHVTDRETFRPVETAVRVIGVARELGGDMFGFKDPPYEYEEETAPLDILWGGPSLREELTVGKTPGKSLAMCRDFLSNVPKMTAYE